MSVRNRNLPTFIMRPKPGGGVVAECYDEGCKELSVGLYYTHSGAAYPACDQHLGACHEECWPIDKYPRRRSE